MTIQMKATEQYCSVVLFIMSVIIAFHGVLSIVMYNVVLNIETGLFLH